MSTDIKRMENLIEQLNEATRAYDAGKPYMSDHEWDDLYFELVQLERKFGYAHSDSPTQKINFQLVSALKKIEHNHPMLSLEKTKDLDEVRAFVGKKQFLAMLKMDGLTCSLRYYNGKLQSAETRGDGKIGEDVLHNALVISSIPKYIAYKGELIIDGEIICCLDTFSHHFADGYKNARNFAAGSIRLLDSKECYNRDLTFVAWDVIKGYDDCAGLSDKLQNIYNLGFVVVPYLTCESADDISETLINSMKMLAEQHAYPIDGLVYKFNDVAYGRSLGATEHHFRNALAYKFYDETYPTVLRDIEWTMGRTGVLTPIAVFEPIDVDGSTVSRASLHNVDIMGQTLHGCGWVGQKVEVYKANMIIPQIASAEEDEDIPHINKKHFLRPKVCPVCGSPAELRRDANTLNVFCTNLDCEGKLINKLDHFCGKKGLDIKGLSKATLEKLIDWGWVSELADLYHLNRYCDEWVQKPGFGQKSVANIMAAIEASKNPTLQAFISSIGIPLIGKSMSKELVKSISSYEEFRRMVDEKFDFSCLDGFADSKTEAIWNFDYRQADAVYNIVKPLQVEEVVADNQSSLAGYTIVITGKLINFKNRGQLQAAIEAKGGKVVGSVSNNTDFLINNDNKSNSAKNVAAQKLNIPIITESEFTERFL